MRSGQRELIRSVQPRRRRRGATHLPAAGAISRRCKRMTNEGLYEKTPLRDGSGVARCELELRAAGLARRGRLAGRALGLSLGLPLLRALILGAAHPLRRGFQAIADALGLRLGR